MIIIGADPGLKGAIAYLNTADKSLSIFDMPTFKVPRGNKTKGIVNVQELNVILSAHKSLDIWMKQGFIERVGAMPGQGVTSMFSFGYSAGVLEMGFAANLIPYHFVEPRAWKKFLKLPGKAAGGDDAARAMASRLFPKEASQFARPCDSGRADAALIAYYGMMCQKDV